MELKRYLSAIQKWWWLLVASTRVATVSGYFAVSRMPRIYQASTSLIVGQSLNEANPTNQDLCISGQLAQTYREIVTRQPILRGAADSLGLPYVPRADDVSAWLVPGTQLLGISVRDTDPEREYKSFSFLGPLLRRTRLAEQTEWRVLGLRLGDEIGLAREK